MIPAVILAAGASARMGRPKALLPLGDPDDVFVTHLAATLLSGGADDLVVVVGAQAAEIEAAVARSGQRARLVRNPHHDQGQLSSLIVALDVVDRPGVRAVMVAPVDMPLVKGETVRALFDAYRRGRHLVVRPAAGDRHGHPVIFDRTLFRELRAADARVGARGVVAAHPERVLNLPVTDPGAFADIDTPDDYRRYVKMSSQE